MKRWGETLDLTSTLYPWDTAQSIPVLFSYFIISFISLTLCQRHFADLRHVRVMREDARSSYPWPEPCMHITRPTWRMIVRMTHRSKLEQQIPRSFNSAVWISSWVLWLRMRVTGKHCSCERNIIKNSPTSTCLNIICILLHQVCNPGFGKGAS